MKKQYNSNKTLMSSDIGDQALTNGLGLIVPAQVAMAEPVVETRESEPTEASLDSVPAGTKAVSEPPTVEKAKNLEKKEAIEALLANFEQKIKPQFEKELAVRSEKTTELSNLKTVYEKNEAKIENYQEEIAKLVSETDDILKRNGDIEPINKKINALNAAKETARSILLHLETEGVNGQVGLIPTAEQDLDRANAQIRQKVQTVMAAEVQACADRMSNSFRQGVDYFEEFLEAAKKFYTSYGVDIQPDSMQNTPRPREDRLLILLRNGVLLGPTGYG